MAFILELVARLVAMILSWLFPNVAREYGLWYRTLPLCYPRWFRPIQWVRRVRIPGGSVIAAPFREIQGMSLILDGVWQKELTEKIESLLEPGDLFVDVGANMGYFTLLAATRVGEEGMVIALEPEVGNLSQLAANIAVNRLKNVLVISEAASNSGGIAKIETPPEYNTGVASLRISGKPSERFNLAATRTLDDILRYSGDLSKRTVVVKIDAEGFEPEVLAGMSSLMQMAGKLSILCELSPQWCDLSLLVDMMQRCGLAGEYVVDGKWQMIDREKLPTEQTDAVFVRTAA